MERTTYEENFSIPNPHFSMAICPKCNEVQSSPILDEKERPTNLTCHNCKLRFCSYCGGDRHTLMSCRKARPYSKRVENDQRV